MIVLPIVNVKLNPLDALLAAVGYRLISLAKSDNDAYLALIRDRNVTLQFASPDGVARHYIFHQGNVEQALGQAGSPDLTITFKDSLTGAKLLAKADAAALMSAIQDGDMTVEGDYKLILWFAQLARHVGKIPDKYAPYVEQARPVLESAKPYAQKAGALAQKALGKLFK